jgi:hypothetical protein
MRLVLVAIQMLFLALPLHAADPLAALVGSDALVKLRAWVSLKASIPPEGNLSLIPAVTSRDSISAGIVELKPSVGAELLRIIHGPGMPMDAAAGLLVLYNALHAVSTMQGVTYWSVTRGKPQVLFLQSYAISAPSKPDRLLDPVFTEVPAEHEMFTFQEDNSFGKNIFSEHFVARADHIIVKTENLSAITFLLVPIIKPRGLVSQVVVVPSGNDILFYGLACISTGMPLGDKESRVQSLENRLVALAEWLSTRLAAQGSGSSSP